MFNIFQISDIQSKTSLQLDCGRYAFITSSSFFAEP